MFGRGRLQEIVRLRLRSLFRAPAADADLDNELRFHLEMQTAEFVKQGMSETQAARKACRQIGNVTLHKEACRDTRKVAWFEGTIQDFRLGARGLQRNKGFTLASVLTLTLGIGAVSALFGVLDVALLHPVAASHPEELVLLEEHVADQMESGGTPTRLRDWQHANSFVSVGGFYEEGGVWLKPDGPVRLTILRAFGDLAGTLRPELEWGRLMTTAETRGEGEPVAILTAKGYRKFFGADSSIQGQIIRLSGASYQIIGAMSAKLRFPQGVDAWVSPGNLQSSPRRAAFLSQVGRLREGVSLERAQVEINLLSGRMASEYPETDKGRSARVVSLEESIANLSRRPLLTLFAAVACLLFVGCLNIAALVLARGLGRRREAAIRVSVGAGYYRLVRLSSPRASC